MTFGTSSFAARQPLAGDSVVSVESAVLIAERELTISSAGAVQSADASELHGSIPLSRWTPGDKHQIEAAIGEFN